MGIRWWDVAQVVVPIAATVVAGPVGGIVASAAMGAGTGVAKGEGAKGALLRAGIGAGSGALTAGATGAFSKGAEKMVTKGVEKAAMDASMKEIMKAGVDSAGMPIVTDMAQAAGSAAAGAAQHSAKNAALTKVADLTSKARGKATDDGLLKVAGSVSKGAQTVQAATAPGPRVNFSDAHAEIERSQRKRFSDIQAELNGPGFSPKYQYGSSPFSARTVGSGRYY